MSAGTGGTIDYTLKLREDSWQVVFHPGTYVYWIEGGAKSPNWTRAARKAVLSGENRSDNYYWNPAFKRPT